MPQFHESFPHPRAVHDGALVPGGGGAAGNAWEIGIIAGLAEAGLDMTAAADLAVGTSAGATAAAQVRSGMPPAELLVSVLSPPVQPAGQNRERPPSLPMATVFGRMRAIGAAATSAADLQRAMGAFGLESDSVLGPGAEQRRATVAARLPRPEWPDKPMIIVAVDAHTGELAAFDRDSGVDLVDAVTASTALPGLVPTVSINGGRYIDGGVRSADNADLASGYANVVVLSPLGGRSQAPPQAGQFEGLRKQGSRVEVITPDAESRAAMSTNQMDPATRIPAARAGFAQGKQEAARVTFLWRLHAIERVDAQSAGHPGRVRHPQYGAHAHWARNAILVASPAGSPGRAHVRRWRGRSAALTACPGVPWRHRGGAGHLLITSVGIK